VILRAVLFSCSYRFLLSFGLIPSIDIFLYILKTNVMIPFFVGQDDELATHDRVTGHEK